MMKQKAIRKKTSLFDMQFITSSISTTMVLILLGIIVTITLVASNLSIYVRENINFSFLLSNDATPQQILKLKSQLEKKPFVKNIHFISKEEALKEQTQAMGTNPSDFLGYNPFTASLEVKLHSQYANEDSIAKISKMMKNNANVRDILYQQDLLDAVNDNIRNISLVLLTIAFFLTIISFALINNTIRLSIHSKRFLIHTMKLVGASWNFIRRPFLKQSILAGIIAAVSANIVLGIGAYWLLNIEPDISSVLTWQVILLVFLSVLIFGIIITLICAYFSINKYLKMKASALYYV